MVNFRVLAPFVLLAILPLASTQETQEAKICGIVWRPDGSEQDLENQGYCISATEAQKKQKEWEDKQLPVNFVLLQPNNCGGTDYCLIDFIRCFRPNSIFEISRWCLDEGSQCSNEVGTGRTGTEFGICPQGTQCCDGEIVRKRPRESSIWDDDIGQIIPEDEPDTFLPEYFAQGPSDVNFQDPDWNGMEAPFIGQLPSILLNPEFEERPSYDLFTLTNPWDQLISYDLIDPNEGLVASNSVDEFFVENDDIFGFTEPNWPEFVV
jgi:hypothetical protein